ncbi:DUF445 domain-containing protein [Bacillus suaedae]|nr:DUF445 family protein [Bacillus suaedae]
MQTTILMITFMVVIGAAIGGVTNSLAIKMLFRPYTERRIGKWRVPFTPGLIPKRHDELAMQLGKMVIDYLVTAEGLGKKIQSHTFVTGMSEWIENQVRSLMKSELTGGELIEKEFGLANPKALLQEKSTKLITSSYRNFILTNREKTMEQLIPMSLQQKAVAQIPSITTYVLERGEVFLKSEEGKERLSVMIDRFLMQKGTIGNMVSMFLGNDRLVDKVQPALVKFLHDEETNKLVQQLLEKEWNKLKQIKFSEIEKHLNEEEVITILTNTIEGNLSVFDWLDQPIRDWAGTYENDVINKVIPKGVSFLVSFLSKNLEALLKHIHLDEIVQEQVQTFSVERLEELVLSISKKEFKMITYLGALLGGVIGLFQGFIVILLG